MLQYVPPEEQGGTAGAKEGYWKTQMWGQEGWSYYKIEGTPSTPDEVHPPPSDTPSESEPDPVEDPELPDMPFFDL